MYKRILSTLLVFCMVLALLPGTAWAMSETSGTCGDNAWWEFNVGTGQLTVSGTGNMANYSAFYGAGSAPWTAYSSAVKTISIENGITSIGTYAFYNCDKLTSILFSNNLKSIGGEAFGRCTSLKKVSLPSSVTDIGIRAFQNAGLAEINLSEGLVNIGAQAFDRCTDLKNITIPESVQSIGNSAFMFSGLTSVTIPSGVTNIGEQAFFRCSDLTKAVIKNGVAYVGKSMFSDCISLENVVLPESITDIKSSGFSGCINLTDIKLPDSLKTIGGSAFNGSGLIEIYIPKSVTTIEGYAFFNSSLTSVTIPNSVTSIGSHAFYECKSLSDVYYSGSKAQWEQIDGINDSLFKTMPTIHYGQEPELELYSLSYNLSDGSGTVPSVQSYAVGASVTVTSVVPTRTGFTFQGWSDGTNNYTPGSKLTMPASDVVLTAQWKAESTPPLPGEPQILEKSPRHNSTVRATMFEITFDREVAESAIQQNLPSVNPNSNIPFQIRRMSDDRVVYVANQATATTDFRYGANKNILRINPTNVLSQLEPNTQYYVLMGSDFVRFANGYAGPEIKKGDWVFTTDSSHTGNGTLYYTLTYQLDGGTGAFSLTALYLQTNPVVLPTPTRSGYIFEGWSDGTKIYQGGDTFTMPGQDVVLTAQWKQDVNVFALKFVNEALKYVNYNKTQFASAMSKVQNKTVKLPDQWCAAFVSEIARASGVNAAIPYNVSAGNIMKSAMTAGGTGVRFDSLFNGNYMDYAQLLSSRDDYNPQVGDLVAFRNVKYTTGVSHVGIVCDVDETFVYVVHGNWGHNNQTYVCAPAGYGAKNCTYKSSSTLGPGGPCGKFPRNGQTNQNMRIVGYVRPDWSKAAAVNHGTVDAVAKCPVEISVTYGGEVLDSSANKLSASFGSMTVDTSSGDRSISFHLNDYYDVDTVISGTGTGVMEFTTTHADSDGTVSSYVFRDVPITQDTSVKVVDPNNTATGVSLLIYNDYGVSFQEAWYADSDKPLATGPDDELTEWYSGTDYSFGTIESINSEISNPSGTPTYYISIPKFTGGEVIPSTRYAEYGERVTLSVHPDDGYKLDTLIVTNIRDREISLRDLSDGKYLFTMPDTRVSVEASFVKIMADTASTPAEDEPFTGLGTPGISGIVLNPAPMPFTDVRAKDWFYNHADYVWKHYLMSGVSDTQFAPDATTSRAMIWTVLARMNNVRTDVNPGSTWYERGMLWAMEQGVTDGTNPMDNITREQLATMLWRNAGSSGTSADLSQFSDSGNVSDYALTAVRWAVANGILQGSDGKLNPKGSATRAQVAAMVMRYAERIGA